MGIITLTTDTGLSGFYVASIKAAILSRLPGVAIIDISHSIQPFHIISAAFVIKNVYGQFPADTVHIVAVDASNAKVISSDKQESRTLAIKTNEQYFIGPDNGLFSLVFREPPPEMVEITIPPNPSSLAFVAQDVMAKAAVHLAKGGNMHEIGNDYKNYKQLTAWQPIYDDKIIRTTIIYIDVYGDCIFNLEKELFEKVGKGRKFSIDVRRNHVERISQTYNEVSGGELLALFNSFGLLEIAINRGNVSELLGLKEGDSIQVIFET